MRNRGTAAILAFFLWAFGIHRMYIGQIGRGVIMALFFWTFIPTIVAIIDIIRYISMTDTEFNRRYNSGK